MKKQLMILFFTLSTVLGLNAKCDWSTLKLQQTNQRNYFKWTLSGKVLDDTCVDYKMFIYNFQTKKSTQILSESDTFEGIDYYFYSSYNTIEFEFSKKGKYKFYIQLINKCEKCDTAIYRPIEIVQFPGAGVGYSVNATDCKKYKFEMTYIKGMPLKDTCMEYYMVFYKGPWMDTMSQKEWDTLTDYQIGMEYDFPDADFLGYTQTRLADFTFKDTGRVLMYAQWWNKCLRQDTFMFRRLDVCKSGPTSNVVNFTRPEPKLIGMYDMMGRRVYNVKEEELVIYIYSDGTSKKIIKK